MMEKNKTFITDWLGCKVNNYECDAFKKALEENGYQELQDDSIPDLIIINTCSVTSTSDKKSRQLINRYRRKYPSSIICAMGCFCQSASLDTLKKVPADIIIGTSNRKKAIEYINQFEKNSLKIIDISHDFRNFSYENFPIISSFNLTRGYVKIQDGCDNFCSYCIIPYVRGESRSRDADEIINEINSLISSGYKEIVITGIDVASYGLDFKNKMTLSDLIEKIILECPGLYRLRISSIEESMIDEKFISLLKSNKNIASHMHLSLQSGSDSVLKRMNRKYTSSQFYKKILELKNARKDINLTTDVIVGFPGETEEEFSETVEFLKKCGFSKLNVFPFSARKGTVAYSMKNQIDEPIKKERVNALLDLSRDFESEYKQAYNHQILDFLIESYDEESKTFIAHSSNFIEYHIPYNSKIHVGDTLNIEYIFDNVKN